MAPSPSPAARVAAIVAAIVAEKGLIRLEEPVVLRSGALSREFVDAKRALAHGPDLALACEAILEAAGGMDVEFDAVGGMTLGADQFSHVVAVMARCRWFVVRKAPKGRGTDQRIEGAELGPGDRVLLVDDAVTAGGSIREALDVVEATGARVVGAVSLVDRADATGPWFAERGIPFRAIVTYRDLGIDPVPVAPASPPTL